jgi:hypothetical protein
MAQSMEEVLGELVCDLNPYITPNTTEMDIFLVAPAAGTKPPDLSQVELEVDTKYSAEWDFKGQPQRVNTAVRIKYRYGVGKDKTKPVDPKTNPAVYWIEDYLLIGYEGAGGP